MKPRRRCNVKSYFSNCERFLVTAAERFHAATLANVPAASLVAVLLRRTPHPTVGNIRKHLRDVLVVSAREKDRTTESVAWQCGS